MKEETHFRSTDRTLYPTKVEALFADYRDALDDLRLLAGDTLNTVANANHENWLDSSGFGSNTQLFEAMQKVSAAWSAFHAERKLLEEKKRAAN